MSEPSPFIIVVAHAQRVEIAAQRLRLVVTKSVQAGWAWQSDWQLGKLAFSWFIKMLLLG